MLVRRGCLRLFATATVLTLHHHQYRALWYGGVLSCFREQVLVDRGYFHHKNRFATLNTIAIVEVCVFDALTVEESSVCRSEIAQIRMRRIHLEQTMMTREKPIVGQVEMCVGTAPDQKAVVLRERKNLAPVWAGCDFQIYLHKTDYIDRLCNLRTLWINDRSRDRRMPLRKGRWCRVRRGHAGSLQSR